VSWLGNFSPDGRYLVFSSCRDGRSTDVRKNWDLFVTEVETGAVERLTDNEWLDMHPLFSPDGSSLLFESERDGFAEIYLAEVWA
jgi:TolB protein